ncbi:cora-like Mg2+ transporter protein-domain-containing protein [Immersiella caudata]|uniref:Cora-like Mg2+ transporter protein-domain-containing protein n=1 Tax=Immersiella caudata TaxID=314043 RepID=A0AA39XI70_9PEZI|nr:cora-like Mg2+ transporter protein-domain-containing protein [Immersiella caudata]
MEVLHQLNELTLVVPKDQASTPTTPKDLADAPKFPNKYIKIDLDNDACVLSEERPLQDLATTEDQPPGSAGTLFIIEVVDPDISDLLPSQLVKKHVEGRDGLSLPPEMEQDDVFTVYWPRLARQEPEVWKEEERIRAKKFWDVETYKDWDPIDLTLDHRRHYPWPVHPQRGYDFIFEGSVNGEDCVFHAAHECIAFYHAFQEGDKWIGYLLVDPIRYHRVFDIAYGETKDDDKIRPVSRKCFVDDLRPIERLRDAVQGLKHLFSLSDTTEGYDSPYWIKALIAIIVQRDTAEVVGVISKALDEIELSLHDDEKLGKSVPMWRSRLGRWRNTIYHQERVLRLMRTCLANDQKRPEYSESRERPLAQQRLHRKLTALEDELRDGRQRIDNVFQSLMSAMSIVESQKAIQQAEGVSKLTQLAFFFIPISFVATVFGMNVIEFTEKLNWMAWLFTSFGVLAATYLVLYRKEFANKTSHAFQLITSQRSKGRRTFTILKIESQRIASMIGEGAVVAVVFPFVYFWEFLRVCGSAIREILSKHFGLLFAGVVVLVLAGVGTWRLVISNLGVGAQVAIGICVVWAPVFILYCACFPVSGFHNALRRRRRRSSSV